MNRHVLYVMKIYIYLIIFVYKLKIWLKIADFIKMMVNVKSVSNNFI